MKRRSKVKEWPIPTVGALIFNKKQECLIVLTHKWGFTYGIPGGKIEKGETAIEALKREIHEETALRIKPGKLLLVQDCIHSKEFYRPNTHFILMNYVATSTSTRVCLNDEAISHLWITPQKALKLNLNKPTRVLIEHYLRLKKRHL